MLADLSEMAASEPPCDSSVALTSELLIEPRRQLTFETPTETPKQTSSRMPPVILTAMPIETLMPTELSVSESPSEIEMLIEHVDRAYRWW